MAAENEEMLSEQAEKKQWRKQDRFITVVAMLVFSYASILLYLSFSLSDPSKAAHLAPSIFWATVFFLFWYPFGTASLLAKQWLRCKELSLNMNKSREENSEAELPKNE